VHDPRGKAQPADVSQYRLGCDLRRRKAADTVGAIISAAETGAPGATVVTLGEGTTRPSQVKTRPVYFRIYSRRVYAPFREACSQRRLALNVSDPFARNFIASMARRGARKPANKLAQDQPLEAGCMAHRLGSVPGPRPINGVVVKAATALLAIQTIRNRCHATSPRNGRKLWCLSYRMCGELNTDRRIEMRKISLFAIAAALILAGVGAWAASTTQARVDTPPGPGVDNIQLMMNARDLPTEHWVDYSVVFN
jgi:hypothetical protein